MALKAQVGQWLSNIDSSLIDDFFNTDVTENYADKCCSEDNRTAFSEFTNSGIKVKCLDRKGGQDEGEEYWSVYSFTKDNDTVYVQFDGSYASFYGTEFDSWFFVEPKQVQVTQYFKVK